LKIQDFSSRRADFKIDRKQYAFADHFELDDSLL